MSEKWKPIELLTEDVSIFAREQDAKRPMSKKFATQWDDMCAKANGKYEEGPDESNIHRSAMCLIVEDSETYDCTDKACDKLCKNQYSKSVLGGVGQTQRDREELSKQKIYKCTTACTRGIKTAMESLNSHGKISYWFPRDSILDKTDRKSLAQIAAQCDHTKIHDQVACVLGEFGLGESDEAVGKMCARACILDKGSKQESQCTVACVKNISEMNRYPLHFNI